MEIPRVIEPDAIFDRDGFQVWPEEKGRYVVYDIIVDAPLKDYGLWQFHTR